MIYKYLSYKIKKWGQEERGEHRVRWKTGVGDMRGSSKTFSDIKLWKSWYL